MLQSIKNLSLGYKIVLTWLIAALLYGAFQMATNDKVLSPEENLLLFANSMNKQLPIMMDDETQLFKVFVESEYVLAQKYKMINFEASQLKNEAFLINGRQMAINGSCNNFAQEKMRDKGVDFHLYYVGKNEKPIMDFFVTKELCRKASSDL